VKEKSQFYYSSAIKLPSAIGDWTQIKAEEADNDFFEVSEINHSNFDGISKDDLKFVHHIHHKLASLITDHLSHDLNVKIELHTVTATQLLYSDFIDSLNDNVFQANINFSEQGSVNVLFGSKLASMVIDRLVGGKGMESSKQEFNEFELELLNQQLQGLIPHFHQVWDGNLDFSKANMSLFSGQYRPDNQISYRGTTIVFTFYLFFGDGELLRLMVAYPSHLISNLLVLYRKKHKTIQSLVKLDKKTIKGMEYNVIAELGKVKLSMNAIKGLAVGDIISLNKPIHSFIKLKVGNSIMLTAQPCVFKNRLGCQIVLSKKIKPSVSLVRQSNTEKEKINVPVTLNLDSFVDDNSIDAVSDTDYSSDASIINSEELLQYMPSELILNDADKSMEQSLELSSADWEEEREEEDGIPDEQESEETLSDIEMDNNEETGYDDNNDDETLGYEQETDEIESEETSLEEEREEEDGIPDGQESEEVLSDIEMGDNMNNEGNKEIDETGSQISDINKLSTKDDFDSHDERLKVMEHIAPVVLHDVVDSTQTSEKIQLKIEVDETNQSFSKDEAQTSNNAEGLESKDNSEL
tara:strand:+ start:2402 stop:4147 length:1746 start_codon:yes stop_codon:yes gene_type:complete